jgi:hypothetical protein
MLLSRRKNRSLCLTGTGFFESRTVEDSRFRRFNEEARIMFYAINWFVVFSLLALWSLAAWAFHAVTTWTVSNAGVLTGASGTTPALRVPDWLAPWVPPEFSLALASMLSAITPAVEAAVAWAPALAGGLSTAVWVIWAIGSVVLIILGSVVTGLIALLRRRVAALPPPPGGPAAAR